MEFRTLSATGSGLSALVSISPAIWKNTIMASFDVQPLGNDDDVSAARLGVTSVMAVGCSALRHPPVTAESSAIVQIQRLKAPGVAPNGVVCMALFKGWSAGNNARAKEPLRPGAYAASLPSVGSTSKSRRKARGYGSGSPSVHPGF